MGRCWLSAVSVKKLLGDRFARGLNFLDAFESVQVQPENNHFRGLAG